MADSRTFQPTQRSEGKTSHGLLMIHEEGDPPDGCGERKCKGEADAALPCMDLHTSAASSHGAALERRAGASWSTCADNCGQRGGELFSTGLRSPR